MSAKTVTAYFMLVPVIALAIVGLVLWRFVGQAANSPVTATLIGVSIGALVAVIGSSITALASVWQRRREDEQREIAEAAKQAAELTRLYCDLKKMETNPELLSPIKIYREVYRALLQLHRSNEWPVTIEELGLLNRIGNWGQLRHEQR